MAQKIIPQSLRLKDQSWVSKWVDSDENYGTLMFIDFEIKRFLNIYFNDPHKRLIQKVILKKRGNNFNIYIYLQLFRRNQKKTNNDLGLSNEKLGKNIKDFIEYNLNQRFNVQLFIITGGLSYIKLKNQYKIKRNPLFFFLNRTIVSKNIDLLSLYITKKLEKTRRHRQYIKTIQRLLNRLFLVYPAFIGYKIQLKGRLNGRSRSLRHTVKQGRIPLSTISADIKYKYNQILTPYGLISMKIWLLFNKNQ